MGNISKRFLARLTGLFLVIFGVIFLAHVQSSFAFSNLSVTTAASSFSSVSSTISEFNFTDATGTNLFFVHATGTDLSLGDGVTTTVNFVLNGGQALVGTSTSVLNPPSSNNNGDFIVFGQSATTVNRGAFMVNDFTGDNLLNVKENGRIFIGSNRISQDPHYIFFREYDDKQDEPRMFINQPNAGNSPGFGYDLSGDLIIGEASVLTDHWVNEYWAMNQSGHLFPFANNSYDFGSAATSIRNLYVSGTANIVNVTSTNVSSTSIFSTYGSITNATSTGFFGTFVNGTTVTGTTGNFNTLTGGTATLGGGFVTTTGLFGTALGFTNATGTGLFGTLVGGTNGVITNATTTNFISTNASSTNVSSTSLFVSNILRYSGFLYSDIAAPAISAPQFALDQSGNLSSSGTAFFNNKITAGNGVSTTGGIYPTNNNLFELGSPNLSWGNLYVSGTTVLGNVSSSKAQIVFTGLAANNVTDNLVCITATGTLRTEATNCTVSSIRFKEHVQSLDSSSLLEKVKKLRAVMFDYKSPDNHGLLGTQTDEGFIAEEVAMVDPYLVSWEEANPVDLEEIRKLYPSVPRLQNGKWFIPHTVAYDKISVLEAGAIQAEDARITALENRVGIIERLVKWIETLFTKKK